MKYEPKQQIVVSNIRPCEWKLRNDKRGRLIDEYIKNFIAASSIWSEAMRDGWDMELRDYLYCVANVQAQFIVGEQNIGYSSMGIWGAGNKIQDNEVSQFLHGQKRQAQTGFIDVAIPTGRIADWKSMIEWRRKQVITVKTLKTIQEPKLWNPGLDEYISQRIKDKIA